MTIRPLTRETADAERERLLAGVRYHRRLAAQRLRDLDRLEADCARVGIRLIREPKGEPNGRPDPDNRRPGA
jgi:hypothetical protein